MQGRSEVICHAVAAQLRDSAETLFLTQTELARRTGISQSQISKLLRAERTMSLYQMLELCAAMNLSAIDVLRDATASVEP
ncbi:helix-turn-helix domain-containing protein [Microbacterium arborescens]